MVGWLVYCLLVDLSSTLEYKLQENEDFDFGTLLIPCMTYSRHPINRLLNK